MKVYLDNAASTPLDPEVFEAMKPWLLENHGNPSSSHHHGRILRAEIEKSRKKIATFLGAAPSEIFFTSGGTEADNMAIQCCIEGLGIKHIITTVIEHHAVTHCVEKLEKKGIRVTWLPVNSVGRISLIDLENALKTDQNAFVSIMHANNELGTINDIRAIGEICHRHGAKFHSDTVQTMAHVHSKLREMPIDFITGSAHKFYGPKGVGFLYIRSGILIPPFVLGGSQERNQRAGTENVPGIVGMAAAMEKCYGILEEKTKKLRAFKSRLKAGLEANIPGIKFNGDTTIEGSLPTILNVAFPSDGSDESMILFNLDINGISVSGGSACTSGSVKGSHVLAGIGCSPDHAANSVRFSFGVQNTNEDIDFALEKIKEIFPVKVNG